MINGVALYNEKHIIVENGDIYHALKSNSEGFAGFGEAYFSEIQFGKVKGWKRHNRFPLNIVVPFGEIKFVIYDDRKDSSTCGHFMEIILSKKDYKRLYVAPGLWMAFMGMAEGVSMLMDIIPETHTSEESSHKELNEINYKF